MLLHDWACFLDMPFHLTNGYLNNHYFDYLLFLFILFYINYIHNIAPFLKIFVLKAYCWQLTRHVICFYSHLSEFFELSSSLIQYDRIFGVINKFVQLRKDLSILNQSYVELCNYLIVGINNAIVRLDCVDTIMLWNISLLFLFCVIQICKLIEMSALVIWV